MTEPKVISSEKVYNGKVFDVFLDKIKDGEVEYERDVVTHHGSAVIVPVFADKTVALVKNIAVPRKNIFTKFPPVL